MIYDVHQYTCRYGTVGDQLALYARLGRAVHKRHLGDPVVFGTGESGDLDSFTHVWQYADAADRERRRGALLADPDWQAYLKACREAGHIVSRSSYVLKAASFDG